MAYVLKYQSTFYNVFGTEVNVYIYKQDYVGAVTNITVQELSIECNYQDENTAIVGSGAKVVMRADPTNFSQFEDLLTSLEKQFKCIIAYGSEGIIFQGYSLCDLNERQLLPYAAITLQFTDYLRRLESVYLSPMVNSGNQSTIMSLIGNALEDIIEEGSSTLLVNSTLFETRMNQGASDDFLTQTYLDNSIFYTSPTEHDHGYEAINKALLTFGAHLYSYGSRWCLERQEDILRDGDWIRYAGIGATPSGDPFESQKQVLHKQDSSEGFDYVETSQIVAYESGLRILELDLQDQQLDSFVFNNYFVDNMIAISDLTPDPGTLEFRQWYYNEDITIVGNGYAYRDMSSYVKWMYAPSESYESKRDKGLYYAFEIQFPVSPEEPVIMSINYKQGPGEGNAFPDWTAFLKFCIRIDGGPRDGQYLTSEGTGFLAFWPSDTALIYVTNDTLIPLTETTKPVYSVGAYFNLTDRMTMMTSLGVPEVTSVWEELGSPEKQKFMIFFLPLEYYLTYYGPFGDPRYIRGISDTQYLGDIQVNLTGQKIPNKLTYYINADFERTEVVDLNFFDLDNINFANGPLIGNGSSGELEKTISWSSELVPELVEIQDIFALNKFRIYSRTIHRLKGSIRYDGYIKPFAVITDDNLKVDGENIQFILHNYTWDLNNGIFDIDAQEYSDEVVSLEQIADSTGYEGDEGVAPGIPTNLDGTQNAPGDGFDVSWDAVTGASSYTLQRMPYWFGGEWVMAWKTVYEGGNTNTYDDLEMIGLASVPVNGQSFFYRVLARTPLVTSAYSSSVHLFWLEF